MHVASSFSQTHALGQLFERERFPASRPVSRLFARKEKVVRKVKISNFFEMMFFDVFRD